MCNPSSAELEKLDNNTSAFISMIFCLGSGQLDLVIHYHTMISDVQLALFANVLGILVFVLVVLYHYVAANNPKKIKP